VGHVCALFALWIDPPRATKDRSTDVLLLYNGDMHRIAVARNGVAPSTAIESRRQAAADALGLLRAEGLEPSVAHEALAARWVAGEIDDEQFELLNLEQVRERLAATASR
jgi:hypothetical protein